MSSIATDIVMAQDTPGEERPTPMPETPGVRRDGGRLGRRRGGTGIEATRRQRRTQTRSLPGTSTSRTEEKTLCSGRRSSRWPSQRRGTRRAGRTWRGTYRRAAWTRPGTIQAGELTPQRANHAREERSGATLGRSAPPARFQPAISLTGAAKGITLKRISTTSDYRVQGLDQIYGPDAAAQIRRGAARAAVHEATYRIVFAHLTGGDNERCFSCLISWCL